MSSLLSNLSKKQQQQLLDDLNYLNTAEIKSFCKKHAIPYTIAIETNDGTRRRTNEDDRKGVMLHRLKHFLTTGTILKETRFPSNVVCFDPLPQELAASHKLFYGQYDKTSGTLTALLKGLTAGKFEDGAIARILAREFWSKVHAPTLQEFASAWLQARSEHSKPNPEWAFLSDRANKTAGTNWKAMRAAKAKKVMKLLNKIKVTERPARTGRRTRPW
jgi:hypothetical protein